MLKRGLRLKLTDKAVMDLRNLSIDLNQALNNPGKFEFEGKLFTGFGEGAYYLSKKPYKNQINRVLGFDPYPGTLNLKLEDKHYIQLNIRLKKLKGMPLKGFEDMERSYGGVKAFRAIINGIQPGAILCALRTVYGPDTVELIAPVNLKEKLGIRDGDILHFIVFLIDEQAQ